MKKRIILFWLILAAAVAAYVIFAPKLWKQISGKKPAVSADNFDKKLLQDAVTTESLLNLASKYPQSAPIYEKLGEIYSKEKNWPKAIENYEIAIKINPNNAWTFNNLGNACMIVGDKQRAIDCWAESVAIDPNQAENRLNLATAYYNLGRLNEALVQLETILRIDPNNEKAKVLLKRITK